MHHQRGLPVPDHGSGTGRGGEATTWPRCGFVPRAKRRPPCELTKLHAVRRTIAIVLLVLLPLQWGWALAAAYCKHEAALGQAHFGHHEHSRAPKQAVPKAPDDGVAVPSANDSGGAADAGFDLASDADCGICHLSAVQAAVPFVDVAVEAIGNELEADYQANWSASPSESFFRPPLTARL